jgi:hypothetical protein
LVLQASQPCQGGRAEPELRAGPYRQNQNTGLEQDTEHAWHAVAHAPSEVSSAAVDGTARKEAQDTQAEEPPGERAGAALRFSGDRARHFVLSIDCDRELNRDSPVSPHRVAEQSRQRQADQPHSAGHQLPQLSLAALMLRIGALTPSFWVAHHLRRTWRRDGSLEMRSTPSVFERLHEEV